MQVRTTLDALARRIVANVARGEDVQIRGLGRFDLKSMEGRPGRNPRTGEAVDIPARKTLRFKVSKPISDELNRKG
ncbi:HU family DNA-binding protein [Salinarimonas soli]|uniref:HU family DNA-binding protein n=1 Tax=Salinarimonas soli TaxID=1638099 RepID=UPI001F0AA0E9|nr:HU family DNA-binding protein [Salinarimonas soli]